MAISRNILTMRIRLQWHENRHTHRGSVFRFCEFCNLLVAEARTLINLD